MADDKPTAANIHIEQRQVESPMSPNEKSKTFELDITPLGDGAAITARSDAEVSPEMKQRVLDYYGQRGDDAPRGDVEAVIGYMITMTDEEALEIINSAIAEHAEDPNFPSALMNKIKMLSFGHKAAGMEEVEWSFELRLEATIIHYHSPYPEVRAVTDPFDDADQPCETPRAYFLGMCFMAGATALNTFFTPRQPAISISSTVLQLLLPPCGWIMWKILPDWSFTMPSKVPLLGGARYRLNPGPWSYKEQTIATTMFTIASGAGGTYYVYLVQMLPQYLNQSWVNFGYEVLLAFCAQYLGFGFAGLLRRFVIFPTAAIWPKILPALALNRALLLKERKDENINGWKFTRYQFFFICFGLMFVWFWIPNTLFQAFKLFNWMTWIAPTNYALAAVTGGYGGMGYNPLATFDWNISGDGSLVTPFYSTLQQYIARVISGLIIIGMHWSNWAWGAFMPINSNEPFDSHGDRYNVSRIMGNDGYVNVTAYADYGPVYYSSADLFGQGAWFAWYSLVLTYVTIRNWTAMKTAFVSMGKSIFRRGGSIYDGHNDAHTRMIRKYKEVPEWWFLCVLALAFASGVAAIQGWPTHTPWWTVLTIMALNAIFLVPSAILMAAANVTFHTGVLFQMLAGVWFAGNPQAQIIVQAFAQNFHHQADSYISDLKIAHYAKVPPRAVFRAQFIAVFLNCFIFIGLLNWMVNNFDGNGTLCTWNNPQRFVCEGAVLYYGSAVRYGAFGVRNMFKLYPALPWCFLIGGAVGTAVAVSQKYGPRIKASCQRKWTEAKFETWNKFFFAPLTLFSWFDPAVFWSGALNWTGGSNLSYATNGLYLSFIFMYHIKRRYSAWFEKYNYLIAAGFGIGVAISGIVQTLIFAFSNNGDGISLKWWGNNVGQAGYDYQFYIQNTNISLIPIPAGGFGLPKDKWPFDFGGLERQYGY